MDTGLLRTVWSVIEGVSACELQRASASEQVRLLLRQIEKRVALSSQERSQIQQYLTDRRTLIRDIALEQVM